MLKTFDEKPGTQFSYPDQKWRSVYFRMVEQTIYPERFEGLTHVLGFSIKYNIKLFLALKKKS